MGGLWVDYNLQSTIPGLFVIGEANFSDHGANRLGASALMQGLADGYFVLPYTLGHFLAQVKPGGVDTTAPEFAATVAETKGQIDRLLAVDGKETVDSFHRRLGNLMIDECGMSRTREGLTKAIGQVRALREEYWQNVSVPGSDRDLNQALERAGRVADFLEFAEVMLHDALEREESCGGHFREEHQHADGEAKRDDENFSYVAAWEWRGTDSAPVVHKEALSFHYVKPSTRSYK
jgi:succinate dehydrogenase / fumarate reductase flavoprotein subunit